MQQGRERIPQRHRKHHPALTLHASKSRNSRHSIDRPLQPPRRGPPGSPASRTANRINTAMVAPSPRRPNEDQVQAAYPAEVSNRIPHGSQSISTSDVAHPPSSNRPGACNAAIFHALQDLQRLSANPIRANLSGLGTSPIQPARTNLTFIRSGLSPAPASERDCRATGARAPRPGPASLERRRSRAFTRAFIS